MMHSLAAQGISADMVVGSSVGALNGAYYAGDPTLNGVLRLETIWRGLQRNDVFPISWRTLLGFVWRRDFLIPHDGIQKLIDDHLPYRDLQQAKLPVHIVTTDIVSGDTVVLSEGPAAQAIIASTAIPGAFAPIRYKDFYLADGAISSNTPIKVAVAKGATRLIILPTGYACATHTPPAGAVANALHALTLLIARQLVSELESLSPDDRIRRWCRPCVRWSARPTISLEQPITSKAPFEARTPGWRRTAWSAAAFPTKCARIVTERLRLRCKTRFEGRAGHRPHIDSATDGLASLRREPHDEVYDVQHGSDRSARLPLKNDNSAVSARGVAMETLLLPFSPRFIILTICAVVTALLLGLGIVDRKVFDLVLMPILIFGGLTVLGIRDLMQKNHAVLRNYPISAHLRFLLEEIRPEMRQYFFESEKDGMPFSRDTRAVVYQRAKMVLDKRPFGTQEDVYRDGYEWIHHSVAPKARAEEKFRLTIGGPDCTKPYSASVFNISAMSFGALSPNAVRALNAGAQEGRLRA